MKTKYILGLILLVLFQVNVCSQEKEYKVLVMGVPQYLFMNGLRIDIDKNLESSNRWIVFSPELYNAKDPAVSEITARDYEILKIEGVGLGISYKYILSKYSDAQGVYLSGGGSYNYFNIRTEGLLWTPESPGATTYIQSEGLIDTQIHKMGVQAILGIQKKLASEFFIDTYIGFGLRLSLDNTSKDCITDLSTFYGDYAFSGIALVAGIRFGLGF